MWHCSRAYADVTFVLKNGDRVSGTLVYRHTTDFTVVRDGREQTHPSDNIALIQFVGGDPSLNELEQLPNVDNNPNELERHVFVFRNGTVMRGKLHDIVDDWFDFDAQAGGRRKHGLSELARLYFNPASARRVYNYDARKNEPQQGGAGSGGGEVRVRRRTRGRRPGSTSTAATGFLSRSTGTSESVRMSAPARTEIPISRAGSATRCARWRLVG